MSVIAIFTTALLTIHAANSYILLTANLEDVQTLAKQLAASPVVDQLNKIWRRASSQFNQHMAKSKIHKRVEDSEQSGDEQGRNDDGVSTEDRDYAKRRSQDHDDLVALGKNASLYLKSIKKVFEQV